MKMSTTFVECATFFICIRLHGEEFLICYIRFDKVNLASKLGGIHI
ncbi:hypothetical protein N784_03805 [Pontibacillus litoralis JSM 072002]|uniref:Uncharacterized protein n=1 Tax=Pontibacillus litoralis JSM 072002 TaxID=1385512 RepID=A0A0A5G3Z4_9BACI|nr:hypothetical protein N784_03805 [Pontibacillus litoralis JSM 072002]